MSPPYPDRLFGIINRDETEARKSEIVLSLIDGTELNLKENNLVSMTNKELTSDAFKRASPEVELSKFKIDFIPEVKSIVSKMTKKEKIIYAFQIISDFDNSIFYRSRDRIIKFEKLLEETDKKERDHIFYEIYPRFTDRYKDNLIDLLTNVGVLNKI